jgi:hypothetical protein
VKTPDIKNYKKGRHAGNDNINSELHKYAPREFIWRLLNSLNKVHIHSTIPNEQRETIVIPILKKGDKMDSKNYRGINILNTCYKVYSKITNTKLKQYSEKFMSEEQNGFRKGRLCADAIFTLKY